MNYAIDLDAFTDCLDCVDSIKVNGDLYISVPILKEFINRFPKYRLIDMRANARVELVDVDEKELVD